MKEGQVGSKGAVEVMGFVVDDAVEGGGGGRTSAAGDSTVDENEVSFLDALNGDEAEPPLPPPKKEETPFCGVAAGFGEVFAVGFDFVGEGDFLVVLKLPPEKCNSHARAILSEEFKFFGMLRRMCFAASSEMESIAARVAAGVWVEYSSILGARPPNGF